MLMESSLTHRPPEAQAFLRGRGSVSEPPARAYAMLMSIAEAETSDRCGIQLLSKLRSALSESPDSQHGKQATEQQIVRWAREMYCRRRLSSLRDKQGDLVTNPRKVPVALQENWAGIMAVTSET